MAAGRSEDLPDPLRTLLLLIYGYKTVSQFLNLAAKLPVGRIGLYQLEDMGLIEVVPTQAMIESRAKAAPAQVATEPIAEAATHEATHTLDESAQQKLLYPEFVRAVADLGFRGVFLQLKVERAMSATDLLALREQVEAAVLKSKGEAARQDFVDRVAALLSRFYWR